ncbi:cytochrome b [Simplicispira psychrophila]|uniref:cytochrome b n=1 Tax=Simplicispira psychrophila TaxID=80882 RepID=UPI0004819190|nr:cytochrome b [Simplicispira psychrophila]
MTTHQNTRHFSPGSITLHWLMAVLLVAAVAAIEFKDIYPKGSAEREWLKTVHFMLGTSIFILVWLRLLARALSTTPPITPALPAWQATFSHWVQWALYALMVALPVLGWLVLSASGKPVTLLWGLHMPLLPLTASRDTALWFKEIHETGATVGYGLVALHSAAALVHHYFQHDNTLLRMLPGRG